MRSDRALKKESIKKKQEFWQKTITILSVLWVVFQLYYTTLGTMEAIIFRAITGMMFLIFCFLIYPVSKKKPSKKVPTKYDLALILLTIIVFVYFILNYHRIALKGGFVSDYENIIGLIAIVIVFIGAKRSSGGIVWLAGLFILYNFAGRLIPGTLGHAGFSVSRIVGHMFWGSQGIFGSG